MSRRTPPPPEDVVENIIDTDVEEEMQGAFLEYAYSVIYSRALPDARDGLKPVQRRILYGMHELGLRPDKGHVKSSRIVGEVMGKYHPHGDTAIYDALVRLAQPFTMRLPLVDGHGNFGSLDDGPAAARYTEARMAPAAMAMVTSLDEDTVPFVPNYDDSMTQPEVLPAAFPNLLVNGAAGIAVGMATNMAPHNLVEVVGAARYLIGHPEASVDDLMRFVPGPDLPCGGRIVGLSGIRDAYETGRGSFKTRATARIENVTPRKKGIVVTELPYLVGPEKVIERIKDLVGSKKLQGISAVNDLSGRHQGLELVIEVKNGFNPDAVLEQLYKLTPMEENFGINNVALVDGQPQTLGLKDMLRVYLDFREEVVKRRTQFRLGKKQERLHLVEGLLVAILNIDEVIQIIRSSDDSAQAKSRLMQVFDLSEPQAVYILDLQLRRLTKFSRIELEGEADELRKAIAELEAILADREVLLAVVSEELAEMAREHGTPRRTVLLESAGSAAATSTPLEVADDPCWVLLSSSGLLARTGNDQALGRGGPRKKHDAVVAVCPATARGEVGLVTTAGRLHRLNVLELPTIVATSEAPTLTGGVPLSALLDLPATEEPLTLARLDGTGPGLALGTEQGVVKRVVPEYPGKEEFELIGLKDGDRVVGAVELVTGDEELVFISSDAHLLHFGAASVRPQGRSGGGIAGIKLGTGAKVVAFQAVDLRQDNVVVTVSGTDAGLPGTETGAAKVTPFAEYPAKGRGTGGVRCHRFLKGEASLLLAWAGAGPARAAAGSGAPVELPPATGRRDGSGVPLPAPVVAVAPSRPEDGAGPAATADAPPRDDAARRPAERPRPTDREAFAAETEVVQVSREDEPSLFDDLG